MRKRYIGSGSILYVTVVILSIVTKALFLRYL
jgi:hypothetical protein